MKAYKKTSKQLGKKAYKKQPRNRDESMQKSRKQLANKVCNKSTWGPEKTYARKAAMKQEKYAKKKSRILSRKFA